MRHLETQRDYDAIAEAELSRVTGTYPPTEEQKLAAGYRHEPPAPPLADGYTRVSMKLIEGDGVTGQWEVVDRLTADIEAEARAADLAANADRYKWENRTILFLRRIGAIGENATSAPDNIEHIIEDRLYAMSQDPSQAAQYVAMVTRASVLRDQIIRYGGVLNEITWHEGVEV